MKINNIIVDKKEFEKRFLKNLKIELEKNSQKTISNNPSQE